MLCARHRERCCCFSKTGEAWQSRQLCVYRGSGRSSTHGTYASHHKQEHNSAHLSKYARRALQISTSSGLVLLWSFWCHCSCKHAAHALNKPQTDAQPMHNPEHTTHHSWTGRCSSQVQSASALKKNAVLKHQQQTHHHAPLATIPTLYAQNFITDALPLIPITSTAHRCQHHHCHLPRPWTAHTQLSVYDNRARETKKGNSLYGIGYTGFSAGSNHKGP